MAPKTQKKTKKQIIHEAAVRLFRDKGYSATSMRDLADAVNLKASSLYNHISSKEEILKNICFENAQRFLAGMEKVEATPGNATEKVEALLRLHIRTATGDAASVMAFNDEWRHLTEPLLGEFMALRKDYENRFLAILNAGMQAGQFRDIEPTIALHTIFSSIRWLHDWFQPGKKLTAEEVEEHVVRMLMKGLSAS
ncbi:MAG: TetR/AcrR family transcriptional regulator [Lewinellaceae bacterium]|nr:TetR family transcriptional regulator [Phaeodactylibacter sp.]MCB9346646.1 TetR/AcrR family transcriptional regulator [Lewinellaceae bacterium]